MHDARKLSTRILKTAQSSDSEELPNNVNDYMLLCASANRTKSWSCEHCPNWKDKDIAACQSCYWAYPESYQHVALCHLRRLDLIWSGAEIVEYEAMTKEAAKLQIELPEYVKQILRHHFKK